MNASVKKLLPYGLSACDLVPGATVVPLETGTVCAAARAEHTARLGYLGPDVGCGMLLARFEGPVQDVEDRLNSVASALLPSESGGPRAGLADRDHFVTVYRVHHTRLASLEDGAFAILVHAGVTDQGHLVPAVTEIDELQTHQEALRLASENRHSILMMIRESFKIPCTPVLETCHNSIEVSGDRLVYRKGAVRVTPGDLTILPSSMAGSALLLRATEAVSSLSDSLPHATGRVVTRDEARAREFFLDGWPRNVYVPYFLDPESFPEQIPANFRTLADMQPHLAEYATVEAVLDPVASLPL